MWVIPALSASFRSPASHDVVQATSWITSQVWSVTSDRSRVDWQVTWYIFTTGHMTWLHIYNRMPKHLNICHHMLYSTTGCYRTRQAVYTCWSSRCALQHILCGWSHLSLFAPKWNLWWGSWWQTCPFVTTLCIHVRIMVSTNFITNVYIHRNPRWKTEAISSSQACVLVQVWPIFAAISERKYTVVYVWSMYSIPKHLFMWELC